MFIPAVFSLLHIAQDSTTNKQSVQHKVNLASKRSQGILAYTSCKHVWSNSILQEALSSLLSATKEFELLFIALWSEELRCQLYNFNRTGFPVPLFHCFDVCLTLILILHEDPMRADFTGMLQQLGWLKVNLERKLSILQPGWAGTKETFQPFQSFVQGPGFVSCIMPISH